MKKNKKKVEFDVFRTINYVTSIKDLHHLWWDEFDYIRFKTSHRLEVLSVMHQKNIEASAAKKILYQLQ